MRYQTIVLTAFLLASTNAANAQLTSDANVAAKIDEYAAPLAKADHLSGTLLVARGDQVIYERSWGFADREQKIAFKADTNSCVASVNKPVTVIIVSNLIEKGTIGLKDPISNWLKDFPLGDQILVRDLLYHRSGIPHRLISPDKENVPRTAADMVVLARKSKFVFEPGTKRQYSSGGFSVLVRVMELASGKSYEQLLQETVLEPLDLKNTFHPGPGVKLETAAKSYVWTVKGKKLAPEKHYSFLIGAGALFSTPRDLFKISRALVEGKFGKRPKQALLRLGKLRWNGITNSYRAYLEFDAKTDLTVVMVSNQMVGANDLLRQNVPRIVAGQQVKLPVVPQPKLVSLPADLLQKYSGRYKIAGSAMPVRAQDGALFANEWILLPTSETSFFSPQDYGTIKVMIDDDQVNELDWSGMKCPKLGPLEDG
jgi:CubicO group peptidase (beta-lactamase class C family)